MSIANDKFENKTVLEQKRWVMDRCVTALAKIPAVQGLEVMSFIASGLQAEARQQVHREAQAAQAKLAAPPNGEPKAIDLMAQPELPDVPLP